MKVSVNWMKQFGGQGLDTPIDELVERIGAQLGAVEDVEKLGEKYKGVVVVRIVECEKLENSDHLNRCLVDDGGKVAGVERNEQGLVQVITGAPNVHAEMWVVWLPPGTTVPESVGKDPFVLESRPMRGAMSHGMLASARELALSDEHEGILELDGGELKPGDDFAAAYGLDDVIIDIENKMFTHRPDCFGQLGVAREIAGISGQKFTSPSWYLQTDKAQFVKDGADLPLQVRNELPSLVPRFMVVPLSGIAVRPSPMWLQTYLLRVGVRPISNVVDVTNYMMLLTGQPMHAYDYDKVRAQDDGEQAVLCVRNPRTAEKVELLNGKTIEPRPEAIMIATETKLIGVGGVMGGANTEVDESTKNIILECANFDMYSIRRTSMAHGMFTDAVTRFNKGQSPLQNDEVLAEAVRLLRELAGGKVAGPVVDDNHVDEERRERRWVHPPVPVTTAFVNERLGFALSGDQMKTLLENVEFTVAVESDKLTVIAPFWRTDVETREDVVEEIGRLYGFDKLPLELPERSIRPATRDTDLAAKSAIRASLVKAGANEVLTYSFVHGELIRKAGQEPAEAFALSNALSPDLEYYRLSLAPSLLEKVHSNLKAGYDRFALFEIGKVHGRSELDEDGLPKEFGRVALVVAADNKAAARYNAGAPYYQARYMAAYLLSTAAGRHDIRFVSMESQDFSGHVLFTQLLAAYEPKRSALLFDGDRLLGVAGEFRGSVSRAFKLPDFCAGFELFTSAFIGRADSSDYRPLSRFPGISQDMTFKLAADVNFSELETVLRDALQAADLESATWNLEPLDVYQREDDHDHKQISFRFRIASYDRTMQDNEVVKLLDDVSAAAREKLAAERI